MIAKRIIGANATFGKPTTWSDEQKCHPLAVKVYDHKLYGKQYQSAWEPTPGELEMLNAGGVVILTISGGQPPVNLSTAWNLGDVEEI